MSPRVISMDVNDAMRSDTETFQNFLETRTRPRPWLRVWDRDWDVLCVSRLPQRWPVQFTQL